MQQKFEFYSCKEEWNNKGCSHHWHQEVLVQFQVDIQGQSEILGAGQLLGIEGDLNNNNDNHNKNSKCVIYSAYMHTDIHTDLHTHVYMHA